MSYDWKNLALVAALLATAPLANAAIIDSFDNSTYPGSLLGVPGVDTFDEIGVAGVAGGHRHIKLTATAASGFASNFVAAEIAGGLFSYASGPTGDGVIELTYDGPSLAADLVVPPEVISLDFASFDGAFGSPMSITVEVSDGVDSASDTLLHMGSSFVPFTIDVNLLAFPGIALVDLAALSSVVVRIDPAAGQDLELQAIRTSTMIPEPTSAAIAMLAAAGVAAISVVRLLRRSALGSATVGPNHHRVRPPS